MRILLTLFTYSILCLSFGYAKIEEITDRTSYEEDSAFLQSLYTEIKAAGDVACTDASEWAVSPIGSKACGGPIGCVAHKASDIYTKEKIKLYTDSQRIYNHKWNVVSDCMLTKCGGKVQCIDGKAVVTVY